MTGPDERLEKFRRFLEAEPEGPRRAILYEVLTGRTPYAGDSVTEIVGKIVSSDPPPRRIDPRVPSELETVALKAMEKDPARRYAGAFADDLGRYLSGEPIAARPAGVADRVYRRIRKNPAAAVLGALVVICASAAVALWIGGGARLREEREAAVKALRDQLRVSLEAALQARRKGENREMRKFLPPLEEAYRGAVERAPELAEVEYLMGRMYRAILDDPRALVHQEAALRKEADYAPAIYERVVLLSQEYAHWMRAANDAAAALRDVPAAPQEPLSEEAYQQVLARFGLTKVHDRLMGDCRRLEDLVGHGRTYPAAASLGSAHVAAARGIWEFHQGNGEEARRLLREAVKRDPQMEEAWSALADSTWTQAAPGTERWAEAERILGEAHERDRGYLPHLISRSGVRWIRGYDRLRRGGDPVGDLTGAEQDLDEAIRLDASSVSAWETRGAVRGARGFFRASRGQDPIPDFEEGEKDLARALELETDRTVALRWRGILRTWRGAHRANRGEDPHPDFRGADEDFTRMLAGGQDRGSACNERGYVRTRAALHRIARGEDPSKEFEGAQADLDEALRLISYADWTWRNRGHLRVLLAFHRLGKGEDASEPLRMAEDDLNQAVSLASADPLLWVSTPDHSPAWVRRAELLVRRAAWKSGRGEDPSEDLDAAGKDLDEALKFNPSDAEARVLKGDLLLGRARWMEKRGEKGEARGVYILAAESYQEGLGVNAWLKGGVEAGLKEALGKIEELGQ
jgi:serine/threonine-protein kinase